VSAVGAAIGPDSSRQPLKEKPVSNLCCLVTRDGDIFVVDGGLRRIAKAGGPPEARRWIPLEPGCLDGLDLPDIEAEEEAAKYWREMDAADTSEA
jgi:hypothetical protein